MIERGERERLEVVEGQALVPAAHMYEGLHPTTNG